MNLIHSLIFSADPNTKLSFTTNKFIAQKLDRYVTVIYKCKNFVAISKIFIFKIIGVCFSNRKRVKDMKSYLILFNQTKRLTQLHSDGLVK